MTYFTICWTKQYEDIYILEIGAMSNYKLGSRVAASGF